MRSATIFFAIGLLVLAGRPGGAFADDTPAKPQKSLAAKMQARLPQPVKVGDLLNLPVLDWDDRTIGYVSDVVRTPQGDLQLIVPYSAWFGWFGNGGLADRWRRPVAVPLEAVAILARQIDVLEMDRAAFERAPTWSPGDTVRVPVAEIIRIAIARR